MASEAAKNLGLTDGGAGDMLRAQVDDEVADRQAEAIQRMKLVQGGSMSPSVTDLLGRQ
jgi:hypothetical protein